MHGILQAPLPLFVAQAIFIIVVSRTLGAGTRWVGQPLVIAEIVAGILLGPSLLGWLSPGIERALFPSTSMPLLGMMSQIGLVLFMFLIGLELDPRLLKGRAHTSVAISHSSILLPFGLGAWLAFHLFPSFAPPGASIVPFVLFMGSAMSITAFPVLARILIERRLLHTRMGAVTIACAAVDDVTAWCILAFVVSVARSSGTAEAMRTVVLALVYIAGMLGVVRPALRRFADRTGVALSQDVVAVTIVLLLASSWLTELLGIHALFGAFLFGTVLPKQGGFAAALAEKIEDLVVVFMLPLFFAYSGLRTQLGLLDSAGAWLTSAVVIAVASFGKFGGSFLAARLTGFSWRESGVVGVLMNTRGLMELVVLNVGLDLGVITPKLFTVMVIMALVTTFATTPLLAWLMPTHRLSTMLSSIPPNKTDGTTPSPSPPMLARYTALVCVAFERSGPGLVTLGAAISGTSEEQSRLYALRLVPPTERASFLLDQQQEQMGDPVRRALSSVIERAEALSVKVRPLSFVSTSAGKDICDVAQVKQADVVLLSWHKPMLGSTMLSGTVHEVMESAEADVGVLVDRGLDEIKRILVPYLGSDHDRAALHMAKRIAENTGASVTVLHVVKPSSTGERLGVDRHVREEFYETGGPNDYQVRVRMLAHALPAAAAVEESARGYDLMLIGIGRQWGLEHRSFGLHAEAILAESPISVVVVRKASSPRVARATDAVKAPRPSFATVP